MTSYYDTLKQYFGYDSFRPLQLEIISAFMSGQDTLVVMATSGGKSLCYQLPALLLGGMTIVISPLISLMKDQVDALTLNGVSATMINSSLEPDELARRMKGVESGLYNLVYMAPERIASAGVLEWLKRCKVSALAIDEAHCISQWGHDFRPDYRNLRLLRTQFPAIPVIALTGSATPRVQRDIAMQLDLRQPQVFISTLYRENLRISVLSKRKEIDMIVDLIHRRPHESVIIYCFSRKDTEKLAATLRLYGVAAAHYHGGMESSKRASVQERFIRDDVLVIAATVAFGMGIDKSNVRLVIHRTFPQTMEGYYQEIGRAGRDGLLSDCIMLYSAGDKIKLDYFVRGMPDENERQKTSAMIHEVMDYAESRVCRWRALLTYFGETTEFSTCGSCDVCTQSTTHSDATEISQKILSTILRTGEHFGKAYIIKVLRGSRDKAIVERGHETLSVWGIGREYAEAELDETFMQLFARGYIGKRDSEYPTFTVTVSGRQLLKEKGVVLLPQIRIVPGIGTSVAKKVSSGLLSKKIIPDENVNQDCFEMLRTLRKEIADEQGVPAFIVFSDAVLRQMASVLPTTDEAFLALSGVGAKKLEQYGTRFREKILEYSH